MVNTLTRKVSLAFAAMGITLSSFVFAGAAFATGSTTTQVFSIPVNTVIRADVGTVTELASKPVESEYRGMVCDVHAVARNQGSVHPGNNLIVSSNGSSVVLEDVERASGVNTVADGQLTLGNDIKVSLEMGRDKVFSAGIDVQLTCEEEQIEVCRDGEIITIPKSERIETDTDTCPVHVEVCRDGKYITVTEDEVLPTDTEVCPKHVKVCRDDKVVTIPEDEVKPTDILGNSCPEVLSVTKELPNTGAGTLVASAFGLSTVMAGAYGFVQSKRNA